MTWEEAVQQAEALLAEAGRVAETLTTTVTTEPVEDEPSLEDLEPVRDEPQ